MGEKANLDFLLKIFESLAWESYELISIRSLF